MSREDELELTPMQQMAATYHELYESYVEAGFTADQALQLIMADIRARTLLSRDSDE